MTDDIRDALLERRALASLVAERKREITQDEATRLARPTCDGCGLDHGGAHAAWHLKLCEDCMIDAETLTLDELRDVLAWRLVHDSWTYRHVEIVNGLAERVGFTLYFDADLRSLEEPTSRPAPSPRRFHYAPVVAMRARLTADGPTVRPLEPELCLVHGTALSRSDGHAPNGIKLPSGQWSFCKTCLREERDPFPVSRPDDVFPQPGNPLQRIKDRLINKVHGRA